MGAARIAARGAQNVDEVDVAVTTMTKLMEPAMMVLLGGIVGGLIIAMYLPIFELAGHIKAE